MMRDITRIALVLLSVFLGGVDLYADETVESYKRQIRECIATYSDTETIKEIFVRKNGRRMPDSLEQPLRYSQCFKRYDGEARHWVVYKYDLETAIKVKEAIFQVSEDDCPYHYHVYLSGMRWPFMELYAAYEDIGSSEKQKSLKEFYFKSYQSVRTRGTPPLTEEELERMFERDVTDAKMNFYYSDMGYGAKQKGKFDVSARYMRLQIESYKRGIQMGIREGNPNKPTYEQKMAKAEKLLKEVLPAEARKAGVRLWPWEAAGGWDFWLADLIEDAKHKWRKIVVLAVCIVAGIAGLVIWYKRRRLGPL